MQHITINGREIGPGKPAYIIAEMSANHGGSIERAKEVIHAMKESGADAVKLQTYTPDTLTIDCNSQHFTACLKGTIWEGKTLYELYKEACMPWEWQKELKECAESLGMDCFSTAFDLSSVDFLEELSVPAMKIASFEIVHLPLIRRVAALGVPIILSTGMATKEEISEALTATREGGATEIVLLKCTSAYPASISDANLKTIPDMRERFGVPVGVSDHTLGSAVPVTAAVLGACVIEKHFVLDRERDKGPDSSFSMEPDEFKAMVDVVRKVEENSASEQVTEEAMGEVTYGSADGEKGSMIFRPSIFVVKDMEKGDEFTKGNTRIIRPGYGMLPEHYEKVLGKMAVRDIERGTPLSQILFA